MGGPRGPPPGPALQWGALCSNRLARCAFSPRLPFGACPQHLKELLSARTKLVSLVHVSNVLGAVLDTSYVVEEAHKVRCRGWRSGVLGALSHVPAAGTGGGQV